MQLRLLVTNLLQDTQCLRKNARLVERLRIVESAKRLQSP